MEVKMRITVLCLLIIFLEVAFVTQTIGQTKVKGFEIPSKYVSLLLVSDPKCPIQLSGPTRVIGYEDKTFSYDYTIQNVSKTAVKSFVVENFSWFGDQGLRRTYKSKTDFSFAPFISFSSLEDVNSLELVNFDEKKAKQLRLSDKPRDVWIVIVTEVVLVDGTVYDFSSKYKELEKFIKELELNGDMSFTQITSQEDKVHTFIEKLMESKN